MGPHLPGRFPPASPSSRLPLRPARLLPWMRSPCFVRAFAAHMPEAGIDIRRTQELLGHSDASTTLHTHVLASSAAGLASPLDALRCEEPRSACPTWLQ